MNDLRETVATVIYECHGYDESLNDSSGTWVAFMDLCADAAIRTVIEALAAEAEANDGSVFCLSLLPDDYVTENHELRLPDWLRLHLPTEEAGQ